ncbi:MAG: HD domain-containing protein [Phycisphaerales bacterium]|nr:HD domain-containing protein [Phycisphaerales bacterium]
MNAHKIKVLMIDDQPMVIDGVRSLLLDELDIDFHASTESQAGLDAARRIRPDVILQDLGMPDRDGFDLIREYRQISGLVEVPVIVLSGREDPHTKSKAFHEGADDYMVKGADAVELIARIRHHAERRRGAIEQRRAYDQIRRTDEKLREANRNLSLANQALGEDKAHLAHDVEVQRERIDRLTSLGAELNGYHDLDLLMERILLEARKSCTAESGAVFLTDKDVLRCDYVQNEEVERRISSGESITIPRNSRPLNLGSISGTVAITGKAIRIDDAYNIPQAYDFAFDSFRDVALEYRTQAVLSLPLRTSNDAILGVLQLANPHEEDGAPRVFTEEDQHIIEHFAGLATVALERAHLTRALVMRMIAMAAVRDPAETAPHVNRVAGYSLEVYDGWSARHSIDEQQRHQDRDRLRIAAMLHDVGKVGIPDAILKKPGRLDDHEYAIMQRHTVIGARLFKGLRTDFDDAALEVALHHHERWDGTGYPGPVDPDAELPEPTTPVRVGLAGEAIPRFARIVALADVFDALSTRRSYKESWPEKDVLDMIQSERGGHFDPELVDIFIERIDSIRRIRDRYR